MKKLFLLLLGCFVLSISCHAQGEECVSLYNSAMDLYNKGDYSSAMVFFNRVKNTCGDYRDVSKKLAECESKVNGASKSGISVDKSSVSFGPVGGIETLKVNSGEASWSYGKAPEWIKLSKSKGRLVIECEGNATGEERRANISLYSGGGSNKTSKKIHVTQSESILNVSATSLSFPNHGNATYTIQVNSNDDWNVYDKSGNWFVVTKVNDGVSVICDENPYSKERLGSFRVMTSNDESITVVITQDPSEARLEVESSVRVPWNVGDYRLKLYSNDPDWCVEIVSGGSWCRATKLDEQTILFKIDNNETGYARDVNYRVRGAGITKEINVVQRTLGYASLFEDYFYNMSGTTRITPVSASVYGLGSWGLRISGLMYRWKVVEIDLLNVDACFSKSFQLRWEPMVRGYLPLQSDKHCWTAYLGVGRGVTLVDVPFKDGYSPEHIKTIFELGAECKLKLGDRDDISSRMFVRMDRYFSIGVALDMYNWK